MFTLFEKRSATVWPAQSLARIGEIGRNRFFRNLGSMGAAQIVVRITRLGTTVTLSRLLAPEDFGLAAIVMTAYEFVALFTRNGITAKVVQADAGDLQSVARTAYYMTWVVCAALAAAQALLAVPIACLYHDMRLAAPIAAMSLIYFATPVCCIQTALQQREGTLGRIAFAGAVQMTVDNFLTMILAFWGLGMWAIILPKLLVAPIWAVFVRQGHAWRPPAFRWTRDMFSGWREIATFSRNIVGVELMTTFQANIDNVLVGYFLGVQALGVYFFAFNAGLGLTLGLVTAFGAAVFPHLCEVRGDREALSKRYFETNRRIGLVTVPLVLAQTLLAPLYVPLVFGAKWTPAIPVLMIVCLSALARPFAMTCSQLLKAVGRPDVELRWQFALSVLLSLSLLAAAQFNIVSVAATLLAVQTIVLSAFFVFAPKSFLERSRPPGAAAAAALKQVITLAALRLSVLRP